MPSLNFSVENQTQPPRRLTPAEVRAEREMEQGEQNDSGFVMSMIGLGLGLLAVAVYHDQVRLILHRVIGF